MHNSYLDNYLLITTKSFEFLIICNILQVGIVLLKHIFILMYFVRILIVYNFLASDITIWDNSGEWTRALIQIKRMIYISFIIDFSYNSEILLSHVHKVFWFTYDDFTFPFYTYSTRIRNLIIDYTPGENFSHNFHTNWNIFQKYSESLHLLSELLKWNSEIFWNFSSHNF